MKPNSSWKGLLSLCDTLRFEPHNIGAQLDDRGRYELALTPEFPLSIKLFHYSSKRHTRGGTWHERLELFVPLDGPVRFRMGDQTVALEGGDILVVDNLKLHHVVDFPGFDTRVIVISFQPEFVYSLGSPSGDYTFLLPFYSKLARRPHMLKGSDGTTAEAHSALSRLVREYFSGEEPQLVHAGSKAYLLVLLYQIARRFHASNMHSWEFLRQQQRSLRLKKLFDYIELRSHEKLSVSKAAGIVAMSPAVFMKIFKSVAGMTLVTYLNHVRLSNATRLLRETSKSVAEIADVTGFSDQSYFDKRFKRAFGLTPKDFRAGSGR